MGSPIRGIALVLVCALSISFAAPAYADTCEFNYDCPSGMLCNFDSKVCEPTASSSPAAPASSGSNGSGKTTIIGGVVVVLLVGLLLLSLTWSPDPSSARSFPDDEFQPAPGGLSFQF